MARQRKDGQRDTGIQAKKGHLYIIINNVTYQDGKKIVKKEWISTKLTDVPENIAKARKIRDAMMARQKDNPLISRESTLNELLDIYLAEKKREIVDTTYSGYVHRAENIRKHLGEVLVTKIKKVDVEKFLDEIIRKEHKQPRTVKDIKILFASAMDMAVEGGVIEMNPAKVAKINKTLAQENAKPAKGDENFFSYEEAMKFLELVKTHELYELFCVTLVFGLRRSEVLGLKWSCVDWTQKELTVNHTVTKGTKVNRLNATKTKAGKRTYPLDDKMIKLFEDLKKREKENRHLLGDAYNDNDYIFMHADGTPYYPDYPTKAFAKLIKKHPELPQGITFHGLRVSCVSLLVHEGYDVKRVQKWVGQVDIETTLKVYALVKDKESKREIAGTFNRLFSAGGDK